MTITLEQLKAALTDSTPYRVLFLDIDGPLIPKRCEYLNQTKLRNRINRRLKQYIKAQGQDPTTNQIRIFNNPRLHITFDPVAVSIVNHILEKSDAFFVIHSSWSKYFDKEMMKIIFEEQGINILRMHEDWTTPKKLSSNRGHEVGWWIRDHTEVKQFAIIDNDSYSFSHWPLLRENLVEVSDENGILYEHIEPILERLGIFKSDKDCAGDPDAWRGCIP